MRRAVPALWQTAEDDGFGLFSPNLNTILSHADRDATLDDMIAALADPESIVHPTYQAGPYWDQKDWDWFVRHAPETRTILEAMKTAGFPAWRRERAGAALEAGLTMLRAALPAFDIIKVEEKLTGRTFDPRIDITLLQFSKPHGIKVHGQRFLQSADYDVGLTVRIAAHELLHPPVPMDGPTALAALAVLERDPLIPRIVREHDPRFGYTTLEGVLNEDLCQALDQTVSEVLGVARNPADRWRTQDDGMHVLAADSTACCARIAGRARAARSRLGSPTRFAGAGSRPRSCIRSPPACWNGPSTGSGRWPRTRSEVAPSAGPGSRP